MNEFGIWLKTHRERAGLSLRELEAAANKVCTYGYINQLEQGKTGKKGETFMPDLEIVDALAKALGRPIDEARLAAGYAPATPTAEMDTWDNDIKIACLGAENMTKEERERILMAVKSFVVGVRAERQERERNARGKKK